MNPFGHVLDFYYFLSMKWIFVFQVDSIDGSGRQTNNPAADYSEGASHVLAVIHQILNHHRTLEAKWHAKKIKLHQRLALRLFQEDVKQVSFKKNLRVEIFNCCKMERLVVGIFDNSARFNY